MATPPTDLEIWISSRDTPGGTRLRYVLHSPSGKVDYTHHQLDGETEIRVEPREYQERMLASLAKLGQGLASDGSPLIGDEAARELVAIGRELYRELFPKALKVEYEQFRTRISSLLVVSDEPWIPWELIKPHGKGFDDDFLSCRFELTRWLSGQTTPANELGAVELDATRVLCFEAARPPGLDPLPRAAKEVRLLHELATGHDGVESSIVRDATHDAVVEKLQIGGAGIVHFVGHSEFDAGEPNVSRFLLTDGTSLRPRDLSYEMESRIQQDRPLVFFNSCQVAQQGYTLSRLGGWVPRWILDCGCGAFLGPQWSVSDDSALLFAKIFYRSLKGGETIARAALQARRAVRDKYPGGGAWLAYTVYAHPNATLRMGLDSGPPTPPEPRVELKAPPPVHQLPPGPGIEPPPGNGGKDEQPAEKASAVLPTLTSAWTWLGTIHLVFVGIMFLRNRSVPILPGLYKLLQGDVAAFFAVLFGLPIFYLTLYVAMEYCRTVELPHPARQLSIRRRIALRLPVAFQSRIQGLERFENAYQVFFLFLFVAMPMFFQGYLYVRLMEAQVWKQRERELFSSCLEESLTKYATLQEALFNDNFRIGSVDDRPEVKKIINNVTYFPFWEAWALLLAELVALVGVLRLLWKLATAAEPKQRSAARNRQTRPPPPRA